MIMKHIVRRIKGISNSKWVGGGGGGEVMVVIIPGEGVEDQVRDQVHNNLSP